MTEPQLRQPGGSLLERAARVYDFGAHMRARSDGMPPPVAAPIPVAKPVAPRLSDHVVAVDRAVLAAGGLLVPGAPIGPLAEEFRRIKRHLLTTARTTEQTAPDLARAILVCSARPNDGKTWCALNLAISMAAERDLEVLLIDADFAKPDVMKRFGLAEGAGLLDVLADPTMDAERCIVRTDIPQLSVLPCGTRSNGDTELLASKRTGAVIADLLAADERRILIFDSPPALAASPAAVLANHVGQVMLVVRADRTSDADLREAVRLLDGCEDIQLVLNAVSYVPGGQRYGSYYGQSGQQEDAS